MSVTAINEKMDTGGGNETAGKRTHTRVFLIECDDTADNTATIFNDREVGPDILPRANDSFPGDEAAKCSNVTIRRISELVWEATCPYEFIGDSVNVTGTAGASPWDLPPYNISVSSYSVNKVVEKGYKADGSDTQNTPTDPILLPTGDKFDPPPTKPIYISLLKFSYNIQTFNLDWVSSYRDTVNAQAVTILDLEIGAKRALLQGIGGQRIVVKSASDNYHYWQVDIEMAISNDGFALELLLAGFHSLNAGKKYEIGLNKDSGAVVEMTAANKNDKNIVQATEPQLLTLVGGLVAVGGTPVYQTWEIHYAKNWDSLNLPKSLDA